MYLQLLHSSGSGSGFSDEEEEEDEGKMMTTKIQAVCAAAITEVKSESQQLIFPLPH